MTQQVVNVGAVPNDGTGDLLRDAFIKLNHNDTDLYTFDTDHVAAADPHPGYQLESEKEAVSGYAGLDASSRLTSLARLPLADTDGKLLIRRSGAMAYDTLVATDLPAHATRHQSGGADPIKLDDLAAPDDNTDLNASTTAHGLMQKYPGGTTTFLRADGVFASVPAGGGAELTLNKHVITSDFTITAGWTVYVVRYIEAALGVTIEIGLDADLEIG